MVCRAAVKIYDKRQDKKTIIPCHRHCDAFQILHDFGYKKGIDFLELGQGFLNEHGEWMERAEAWHEANKCHQFTDAYIKDCNEGLNRTRILYSEDIW